MKKNLSGYYQQWKRSSNTELWQVYGRYSTAKANAMDWCKNKMKNMGGHDMRIISANGWRFTVGWLYEENGKKMFNVETSSNSYEWEVYDEADKIL